MSHSSLRNLISYFKKCVDHLKETEFSFDVLYLSKTCAFGLRVKESSNWELPHRKLIPFETKISGKKSHHFYLRKKWLDIAKAVAPRYYPAGIYLLKVKNRNTRTRCEICSKLTIKAPERRLAWFCGFIVNFEHISHLALGFLLITLNM